MEHNIYIEREREITEITPHTSYISGSCSFNFDEVSRETFARIPS